MSSFGAVDREEANYYMLRDHDPCRSSDELHNNGEGAFGSGLCLSIVLNLHLGEQDHHLHRSCGTKVLALQEGGKVTADMMGVASSRVQHEDQI